jgi:hypothetical protein
VQIEKFATTIADGNKVAKSKANKIVGRNRTTINTKMTHALQELTLLIAIKNHDPLMVGEAFLKQTGIIPSEWQLAREPYLSQQATQLVFNNGVSITAEPERVIFTQSLADCEPSTIEISKIASSYATILKKADYQGIGINFRSFIPQPNNAAAQAYLSQHILAPASWQQIGEAPVRANINLNFSLSGRQLTLSINPAAIQFPERELMPVILFGGNFSYQLDANDKLTQLTNILARWQTDLTEYQQIIDRHFLGNARPAVITESLPSTMDITEMTIENAPILSPLLATVAR